MKRISRRDVLKLTTNGLLVGAGLLGLSGIIRFLGYETEAPASEYDLGRADNYPGPSRTLLPYIPAILIRDGTQFTALSLICTHLGCAVDENDAGFACPCHGSHYDGNGYVLKGPADRSLKKLRVEQLADNTCACTWISQPRSRNGPTQI